MNCTSLSLLRFPVIEHSEQEASIHYRPGIKTPWGESQHGIARQHVVSWGGMIADACAISRALVHVADQYDQEATCRFSREADIPFLSTNTLFELRY